MCSSVGRIEASVGQATNEILDDYDGDIRFVNLIKMAQDQRGWRSMVAQGTLVE